MGERITCDMHPAGSTTTGAVRPYRYTENGRHVMLCLRHAHAAGSLIEHVNVDAAYGEALIENAARAAYDRGTLDALLAVRGQDAAEPTALSSTLSEMLQEAQDKLANTRDRLANTRAELAQLRSSVHELLATYAPGSSVPAWRVAALLDPPPAWHERAGSAVPPEVAP